MKYHQIEVDEEVYRYLKKKAEPFVDTPNSVLRRELLNENVECVPAKTTEKIRVRKNKYPDSLLPSALGQILEVLQLVIGDKCDRKNATKVVANRRGIDITSVTDKYTRQLGIRANDFDRLINENGFSELKTKLKKKFKYHKNDIDEFFSGISNL